VVMVSSMLTDFVYNLIQCVISQLLDDTVLSL
jgi:hypothetical protein